MDRDLTQRGLELCLAVYRITDKFPEGEALKNKIRTTAIDICENLFYYAAYPASSGRLFNYSLKDSMRNICLYADLAKEQRWVSSHNFDILKEAYANLYEKFREFDVGKKGSSDSSARSKKTGKNFQTMEMGIDFSLRQKQMVKFIEGSEKGVTAVDLAKIFKISKKTTTREIKPLLEAGFIKKEGNTRSAVFAKIH